MTCFVWLGYWRRIYVANPDRTFSALAKLRIKHFNCGRAHSGWMKGTNELLTARGMASHWADPSLCTERCKGGTGRTKCTKQWKRPSNVMSTRGW